MIKYIAFLDFILFSLGYIFSHQIVNFFNYLFN